MNALEWAVSVKPDLVRLQDETGIPALWAAAQMAHESASGQGLSELARKAHNYAGLKWAEWQRKYGCSPVSFGTWEVLDGSRVDVQAAFCSCPSWEVWLKVYAALLTGNHYRPALAYTGTRHSTANRSGSWGMPPTRNTSKRPWSGCTSCTTPMPIPCPGSGATAASLCPSGMPAAGTYATGGSNRAPP